MNETMEAPHALLYRMAQRRVTVTHATFTDLQGDTHDPIEQQKVQDATSVAARLQELKRMRDEYFKQNGSGQFQNR